jgi:hypothetical protein
MGAGDLLKTLGFLSLKLTLGEKWPSIKRIYHLSECKGLLKVIVKRIARHGLKLNVLKCEFAKISILYLGWIASHYFLLPDPRRMSKFKNTGLHFCKGLRVLRRRKFYLHI